MNFSPIYICGLCGQKIKSTKSFDYKSSEEVTAAIKKIKFYYDNFKNTDAANLIPFKAIHHCKNGSVGIANFVGMEQVRD